MVKFPLLWDDWGIVQPYAVYTHHLKCDGVGVGSFCDRSEEENAPDASIFENQHVLVIRASDMGHCVVGDHMCQQRLAITNLDE